VTTAPAAPPQPPASRTRPAGWTCRYAGRWSAASSTTCPARASPSRTSASDWWVKKLVERENIALLPPAIALRKEDAELDDRLDDITAESEVRRELDDFNRRVVETRRQLQGGPPVVTPTRDVDTEVAAWRERRTARIEAQRAAVAASRPAPRTRSWWSPWRSR
jgi:hypothetical protein